MSETEPKKGAASAINPPFSPLSMPRNSKTLLSEQRLDLEISCWRLQGVVRVSQTVSLHNAATRCEACKVEIPMLETSCKSSCDVKSNT
jgi:hypothetical protein